jgi:hypothetical protein
MSIREMTGTEIVQRCAKCDAENRIVIDSLEAGVARDDQADPRVVALPPCPTCKSTEFLIRSPDDEPMYPTPGSFGHLHRMLVDQVHAELVKRKKIIEALKDKQGRVDASLARPVSDEDARRWFSKGFKIELRDTEQPAPPKEPGQ